VDKLKESLNRTRNERLSRANLLRSEKLSIPVLHVKTEDAIPFAVLSTPSDGGRIITPQRSRSVQREDEQDSEGGLSLLSSSSKYSILNIAQTEEELQT
jgi:hypothetical protein